MYFENEVTSTESPHEQAELIVCVSVSAVTVNQAILGAVFSLNIMKRKFS